MLNIEGFTPMRGGVPIVVDGVVIGAIGVIEIFERNKRGLRVTPVGQRVVLKARELLDDASEIDHIVSSAHQPLSGPFRAGIIATVSRNALVGAANYAAYSAAKGALLRLSESLAGELKAHDITVNCVIPGTIDTPQNREAMPDADVSQWGTPLAIADVIAFLASDAARVVTGAALPVYGKG